MEYTTGTVSPNCNSLAVFAPGTASTSSRIEASNRFSSEFTGYGSMRADGARLAEGRLMQGSLMLFDRRGH